MNVPSDLNKQGTIEFSVLWRLLRYTLSHKKLLLSALGLLVIATVGDVLTPIIAKIFIDEYLLPEKWVVNEIVLLACAFLSANVVAAYFGYQQSKRLADIAQHVVLELRNSVFNHVLALPIRRFDYTPTGNIVSRVTNDTETIKELFVGVLGVYLQSIIKILGIFIAMAYLNWMLMLVCAVFIPAVFLVMVVYRRLSTHIFARSRRLLADINGAVNEALQGMPVIQLFYKEQEFAARFKVLNTKHWANRVRSVKLDALLLRPMVDLLQLFTLIGLLYVVGHDVRNSPIEIGVLYAFINYLGRFVEPLIEMTQRLNLLQQAMVSANRLFVWLDEPVDTMLVNRSAAFNGDNRVAGRVDIDAVTFSYDGINTVLDHVDLQIPAGTFCGVVGHTGSGKSTLMSLLAGFYPLTTGVVKINEQPLSRLPLAWLRSNVAIVQQESYLFTGTLYDNIDLGRGFSDQDVIHIMREVGLASLIEQWPEGIHHALAERGANISAGQRQMVSLARALIAKPTILILDEATASIDSATEKRIQTLLESWRGRCTIIAIAHRLSTVVSADKIIVMHKGRIAQQGTHQTLLSQEGLYKNLYALQHCPSA